MSNTGKQRKSKKTLIKLLQQGIEDCEKCYLYVHKLNAELDSDPSIDASLKEKKREDAFTEIGFGIACALDGLPQMIAAFITAHFVCRAMDQHQLNRKASEGLDANIVMLGKVGVAMELMLKKIDEAPAKARQANAKKAAAVSRAPYAKIKADSLVWLDKNGKLATSNNRMATQLIAALPIAHPTALRYVREWRDRSRLAEVCHSK